MERVNNSKSSRMTWCQPFVHRRQNRKSCCLQIKEPPERPDLATYSQEEEIAKGNIPIWRNPDFRLTETSSMNSNGETQCAQTIAVKIRNLSDKASAQGAKAMLYESRRIGLGTSSMILGEQVFNISPRQEIELMFNSEKTGRNRDREGHYFDKFYVKLDHPKDINLINNKGSYSVVYTTLIKEGGCYKYTIPIENHSNYQKNVRLSVQSDDCITTVTPSIFNLPPWDESQNTILSIQYTDTHHDFPNVKVKVTVIAWNEDGSLMDGLYLINLLEL